MGLGSVFRVCTGWLTAFENIVYFLPHCLLLPKRMANDGGGSTWKCVHRRWQLRKKYTDNTSENAVAFSIYGNFEFTIVMCYLDYGRSSYKPQPSMQIESYHVAVHKNTRERTFEYADHRKSQIWILIRHILFSSFSHTKLPWLAYSLQIKAVIELLHTQNNIAFVIIAPFSLFVCKLARVVVFGYVAAVLWCSNAMPFWATNKGWSLDVCYCTCAVHMQMHFTALWLWWLHSRCLPKPSQSDI